MISSNDVVAQMSKAHCMIVSNDVVAQMSRRSICMIIPNDVVAQISRCQVQGQLDILAEKLGQRSLS